MDSGCANNPLPGGSSACPSPCSVLPVSTCLPDQLGDRFFVDSSCPSSSGLEPSEDSKSRAPSCPSPALWGPSPWPRAARRANTVLYLHECPPVRPEFVDWFGAKFPELTIPFLRRLLFTILTNSNSGRPTPLAKNFLAQFEIQNPVNKNDRGHKWIAEALSKALGVNYREYSNQHHIARSIQVSPHFATEVLEEWNAFRTTPSDPIAINSATFESVAAKKYERIIRVSKRTLATSVTVRFPGYPLADLLTDINSVKLPPTLFGRFKAVGQELMAKRDAADDEDEREDLQRRLVYLGQAQQNAKTGHIYEPRFPAYRLYVREESLQGIDREDRHALTRQCDGYFELDLRNCHFAVIAALAGSHEMNALLDGGSIWDQLMAWCGLDDCMREPLKLCVTAGLYGAGRARRLVMLETEEEDRAAHLYMLNAFRAKTDSPSALGRQQQAQDTIERVVGERARAIFDRLMEHPAMRAMEEARKKLEEQIKNDGGMVDAFDHFVKIPKGRSAATVLHAVATSYERLLIDVVYQRARKNKFGDFRVVLDQHDGVTIHFARRDKKRTTTIIERLQQAVRVEAARLGINTTLEVKNG